MFRCNNVLDQTRLLSLSQRQTQPYDIEIKKGKDKSSNLCSCLCLTKFHFLEISYFVSPEDSSFASLLYIETSPYCVMLQCLFSRLVASTRESSDISGSFELEKSLLLFHF